jgi:hypothetical protein
MHLWQKRTVQPSALDIIRGTSSSRITAEQHEQSFEGTLSGRPQVSFDQLKPGFGLITTTAQLCRDQITRGLRADSIVRRADRIEATWRNAVHTEITISAFPACGPCARSWADVGGRSGSQRPGE